MLDIVHVSSCYGLCQMLGLFMYIELESTISGVWIVRFHAATFACKELELMGMLWAYYVGTSVSTNILGLLDRLGDWSRPVNNCQVHTNPRRKSSHVS